MNNGKPAKSKAVRANNNNKSRNNGKSRNPRKRNSGRGKGNKKAGGGGSNAVRSTDTIISTLAKSTSQMVLGARDDAYTCCRMFGTIPRMPPSIPDGCSGKHMAVCLYSIDRISPGSAGQTIYLQQQAWLPAPVIAYSSNNSTFTVNGATGTSGKLPIGISPEFITTVANSRPGSATSALDPYTSSGVRIVSSTIRVRYTGPVNTCAGMLRAFENHIAVTAPNLVTGTSASATAPTTGFGLALSGSSGVVTAYAPLSTNCYGLDGTMGFGSTGNPVPPPDNYCCRPEKGMIIRMKHRGTNYEQVPIFSTPVGLFFGNATNATAPFTVPNLIAEFGNSGGGTIAFDNDWVGNTIVLENMNSDASYTVETMVCVEFTPQANSPFVKLTKAAPPANLKVIQNVEAQLNRQGPAMPLDLMK